MHFVGGGVGRLRQPAQDLAAALGLRHQEVGVLLHLRGRRLAGHLLGDDGDGGQRRAELMGGGGGQGAEGRQPLLARQDRLGDVQGQRHARRFDRGLAHIARRERDAGEVGDRRADLEGHRHGEARARHVRQRQGDEGQDQRGRRGQPAQDQHGRQGQGGRRQGHGRDQDQQEGVGRTAGEEDQRADLQDVDGELGGGLAVAEHALARRQPGQQVHPGARARHRERQRVGQDEAHPHGGEQQQGFARHHQPAQGDQGAHAQAAPMHRAPRPVLAQGVGAALHEVVPRRIEAGGGWRPGVCPGTGHEASGLGASGSRAGADLTSPKARKGTG